jgi:hypothetical protein
MKKWSIARQCKPLKSESSEKLNDIQMKAVRLTSGAFGRVIALWDLPNAAIRVCDKDFHINQAILPFISTELEQQLVSLKETIHCFDQRR